MATHKEMQETLERLGFAGQNGTWRQSYKYAFTLVVILEEGVCYTGLIDVEYMEIELPDPITPEWLEKFDELNKR